MLIAVQREELVAGSYFSSFTSDVRAYWLIASLILAALKEEEEGGTKEEIIADE